MKKIFRNTFTAAAWLLGTSLLTTACSENNEVSDLEASEVAPEGTPEYSTVPFTVSVNTGDATRATVGWDKETLYFEEGDKLYIEGKKTEDTEDEICVGMLTMQSLSSDHKEATFSGDIMMLAGEPLSSYQFVSYTIIGKDNELYNFETETVDGLTITMMDDENNDPQLVPTLDEAVRKYSDISYQSKTGLTDQITLKQYNSFFDVALYLPVNDINIESVKSVKTTLSIVGDDERCAETEYTPELNEDGSVRFVVPVDNEGKLYTKNIRFDITLSDGRVITENIAKLKGIQQGYVYNIVQQIESKLNKDSQVGEIGIIDGIRGIVVDLGSDQGGKVVFALTNYGQDLNNWPDNGTWESYDFFQENLPGDWTLPTKKDYDTLFKRYKDNFQYNGIEHEGKVLWWASFKFEDGKRSLEFRLDTDDEPYSDVMRYAYWTDTENTTLFSNHEYYLLTFQNDNDSYYGIKATTVYSQPAEKKYGYARFIHVLSD